MYRHSISRSASLEGIGVHGGIRARVTLEPADSGITLIRTDQRPQPFVLSPEAIAPSPLCTLLTNRNGATLSTVEHLLSALHGLGVTDVAIEVDGPEIPILDGSALPWVNLIEAAGLVSLDAPADILAVREPVQFTDGDRVLAAEPDRYLSIDCRIQFPHQAIGAQRWLGTLTPDVYKTQIAPARSFILEDELKQAQAAGFAKGASLEGGVLFLADGTVANPPDEHGNQMRFANEPVRHKVLDAVGDLYLAGRPVAGRFTLTRPGHTSNNALLRKLV